MVKQSFILLVLSFCLSSLYAEDGYRLWLRFDPLEEAEDRITLINQVPSIYVHGTSDIRHTVRGELQKGISGLAGQEIPVHFGAYDGKGLYAGIIGQAPELDRLLTVTERASVKLEGYILKMVRTSGGDIIVLGAIDDSGLLYGSFRLLRYIQAGGSLAELEIVDAPKLKHRLLNHWDNLDRTVERGYAGFSIWNWHQLPEFLDPRYREYARANASIGINGTVVTNVNANALVFRRDYLEKAAALAGIFRPYGIKLYLTARFSAPIEQGGLSTADPLNPEVIAWWNAKVKEIYSLIPDFGGFLVKANSEGQPGPQEYGRSHAEGANLLADAMAPFGGIVMWRAFVYSEEEPEDRAKQAYHEFVPLDGKFRENVMVQVKNGPIDFQPREPIHPMFGAMPNTPLMMEFQITKEYLGQGTHLVGLSTMYEEVLKTDTYQGGPGSTVSQVIDGSLHGYQLTGMAGVSNIGTARNWTGNLFGQADWYAFGRFAWNPYLDSEKIFEEWALLTFSPDEETLAVVMDMLRSSHEACVQYMTPLGLHHIMAAGHHFGPGPWVSRMPRADWTSVYYHRADKEGVGFDRTSSGSDFLSQYHPELAAGYSDMNTCPLPLLLWFHHVPWDHMLVTGNSLWDELCLQYQEGVRKVEKIKAQWASIEKEIDQERFKQVDMHLEIQLKEARWWKDACISYFQSFSGMEIPAGVEKPKHDLKYYESLQYPYAPGIRPRW